MNSIICKDTGEVVYSYDEYLKTMHWMKLKMKYSSIIKRECVMCQSKNNLHLHHMTYENIGNESINDLVYLCKKCHKQTHKDLETSETQVLGRFIQNTKKVTSIMCDCKNCYHYNVMKTKKWGSDMCKIYHTYKPNKKMCKRYYPRNKDDISRKQYEDILKNKKDEPYQNGWENVATEKVDLSKYKKYK